MKKGIPEPIPDIVSVQKKEREDRAKEISEADDILTNVFFNLQQGLYKGTLTNKQKYEMSKFMLRKQLDVQENFILSPTFVLRYMDHGEYVQFLCR